MPVHHRENLERDEPLSGALPSKPAEWQRETTRLPCHRSAAQIHPLAKIAAVADVFVALVSPRPYRPALLHYHAMEQILHGARQGLYDTAVVRALLHTVSLFPIGSLVEINDGRIGKVLRSNRDAYTSPVIETEIPVGR